MKLEAKDRMNPNLICVATVTDVKDGQLLIHFDGWSNQYNYWCTSNATDIHPAGWCKKHGYPLSPPNGKIQCCDLIYLSARNDANFVPYTYITLDITLTYLMDN